MSSRVWAFVVSLFCLALLSLVFNTFSLTSTCSLSWTSFSMWSRTSNARSQNEESCSVAIHNPLTGYEPNHFDNQLDNFDYSETSAVIFQNESVDMDTEPSYSCDAELDDELVGKALIFTTVHSGSRRTSELETNLSLSWSEFVASSALCHTYKYGETRVRTKFKFVSKTEIKSRPGKQANQDSLWKTKRANSCLSQIWDPVARTSSRVW